MRSAPHTAVLALFLIFACNGARQPPARRLGETTLDSLDHGRPIGAGGRGKGEVSVQAGAGSYVGPVQGATFTVVAVDAAGKPVSSVGADGVLGIGGPTDASGHYQLNLSPDHYAGPVQIRASGAGLSFVEPTDRVTHALGAHPAQKTTP